MVDPSSQTKPASYHLESAVSKDPPINRKVRHAGDLFMFVSLAIGIALTLVLTVYAHGILTGVVEDVRQVQQIIDNVVRIPATLAMTWLTYILPLIVIIRMIYKQLYTQLMECAVAALLGFGVNVFGVFMLEKFASEDLYRGLCVWQYTLENPQLIITIPVAISWVCAALVVAGPRSRDKTISFGWNTVYIVSALVVIIGQMALMGVILSILIGLLMGSLVRYLFGQRTLRAYDSSLIHGIKEAGFMTVNSVKFVLEDDRKREYDAFGANGSMAKVYVFDADRQVVGFLSQILQMIKYKDAGIRAQMNFHGQIEHLALIYYGLSAANSSVRKLIGLSRIKDSAIFVFEKGYDDWQALGANNTRSIDDKKAVIQQYFAQLQLIHAHGITHRNITPDSLEIRRNNSSMVSIRGWSSAEIISSQLFKSVDFAQIIISLCQYYERKVVCDEFIKFAKVNNIDVTLVVSTMQTLTLTKGLRRQIKNTSDTLRKIRSELLNDTPQAVVPNSNPIRFSPKAVFSLGLTIVAVGAVITQLNFDAVSEALLQSNHWYALLCFVAAAFTWVGAAIALIAFSRQRVSFKEAFLVQIAASFTLLSLPAGVGPATYNLRMLNKKNNSSIAAATVTLVQVAGVIGTIILLFVLGLLSGQGTLQNTNNANIAVIVVTILAVALIIMAIPRLRSAILRQIVPFFQQFLQCFVQIASNPRRIIAGFLGVFIQAFAYIFSFQFALLAFGQHLRFIDIAIVFLVSNAAGAAVPTPGGLGAVEATLTFGFAAVGVQGAVALSVILLFRIMTLWLRAPIGYIMTKHLEKHGVI